MRILLFVLLIAGILPLKAQIIKVGSGSYTSQFPGVDAANRNGYPSGTPLLTGNAKSKPVPTNDWWSHKVKNNHSDNLFNYPYTLKTVNSGLITTYIPWGVIGANQAITVGVEGLNASAAMVSDYSDWTVSMNWQSGSHDFTATSGIGMPFLYFTKGSNDVASVVVNSGSVTISNEMLVITDASNGADFAVYAPSGSVWQQNGSTYTSTLNGKNYWSMAFLPNTSTPSQNANALKKHAFVFPTNTTANWSYDEKTAVMRTVFNVEVDVKEGNDSLMLMGLLPHQWAHLASNSSQPKGVKYQTVRGELRCLEGNGFSVENTFYGILPTLPYLDNYSNGFNPKLLNDKVELLKNEGLNPWTDSYNEGQMMNKLIQTARIADLIGNTSARDKLIATVQERLEDWLEANSNEVAFIFYYNNTWSAMLGYPAGHGQDVNINDHHFHWGYFIHAAAFLEQYQPGWAIKYGEMVNLLVRDAASAKRDDKLFPFLRNFSPYAGHCWANGFASFPQGNDQESTSESMQFNSSLIHWGTITGNDDIRDLGIYLYTTEQTAIEEYWLDIHDRNFSSTQQYSLVSRVWGNSYDNGTFWTADIAASYGIELYPIHGGSFYLGHDTNYVKKLWAEMEKNTGILKNEANNNLWHDVYWSYLALIDAPKAIKMYNSYPDRELKFGISDAQTYHWLHASNSLGKVNTNITSNSATAMVFTQKGENIYVAQNYSGSEQEVAFSDGYKLKVPANTLLTSKDLSTSGVLSTTYSQAYAGSSIKLSLNITGKTPTKTELYDGDNKIAELTSAPFEFEAKDLKVGKHYYYVKLYDGSLFNLSNSIEVIVGEQLPYAGNPIKIPGSFYAGDFDIFEGGIGQGISYYDVNAINLGDYRTNEYVDAGNDANEGKTVGWISDGEWVEYTIEVEKAGYHSLQMRYACGNQNGGGPFDIICDGQTVAKNISLGYTGDWTKWQSKTINNIPLKEGVQVLKLAFNKGEFNIGQLEFTYAKALDYSQPVADAGNNILVQLPATTANLDGSNSSDPNNGSLTYKWTQVYGPTTVTVANANSAKTQISGLVEGIYLFRLEVGNGAYSDQDEVYVISSQSNNVAPKVSIYSPSTGSRFLENKEITIEALASDLNGTIAKVEFYVNEELIATNTSYPYSAFWKPTTGNYTLEAIAFDNNNAKASSNKVKVIIDEAPSCRGTAENGDFDYLFSPESNNPTLTFIPNQTGMGSPTCLLYYGTNPGGLPGYGAQPNVPFRLNAAEGTTIYFYYTYTHPAGGERNTLGSLVSYEIGSCKTTVSTSELNKQEINFYPNPVTDVLTLELPNGASQVQLFNSAGKEVFSGSLNSNENQIDVSHLPKGLYLLQVENGGNVSSHKLVK